MGASLAGPRAAGTLREEGFTGSRPLIGDEPHEPYEPHDRPPQSKQVLLGRVPAHHTRPPGTRRRTRTDGSGWRPPGWTRRPGGCTSPTGARRTTTGC
ncbi:hypothetical protein [Streptomyces kasugaensis]|uniref:hypothetical protein n=1 Tax=Streptomyces TaxID=1883 RepID=UPI003CC82453